MVNDWRILIDWAEKSGVKLSQDKLDKFQSYYQFLLEWNKKINLISRNDTERIVSYHFIDSITAIPDIPQNSIVCDLGTGAGLPGIPIKIIRDDIKLYLVESIKKKTYFLTEAIKTLELKNTFVLNERAETIKNMKFDIILVRLFGKIFDVLPLVSKLLFPNGKIIFYKIEGVEKEILKATNIANKYNLELTAIKDIKLPVTSILRKLVIYRNRFTQIKDNNKT
jgi:16S rRNA (guanine527-N7)-methyltransferase